MLMQSPGAYGPCGIPQGGAGGKYSGNRHRLLINEPQYWWSGFSQFPSNRRQLPPNCRPPEAVLKGRPRRQEEGN